MQMKHEKNIRDTFVVQIFSRQNAAWQGTVTEVDRGETKCFRSALELIRLVDSAEMKRQENRS